MLGILIVGIACPNPMSYQVLARKYRPKGFDTLVGQEHVVRALSHALDSGRLHHAYLFTGTRGVGKTTLSRILAKAFNCIGPDGNGGVTSHPCGVCEACVAIDAGRFVDYIEIDAASNRGVDEMAQLLEQAVYAPSNARFKVYMIDEVHMLTNHAFNAMLKTLEEPPPHVKFILATTDPQKIPVTVLSRCLQFNLKQMPPAQIIAHLADILGQEQIAFESPALRLLAQGAHGSMRDALSLTDQAIAYAAGNVTLEAVQGMLGALDQSFLVRILDALAERDGAALIAIADDMATRSLSYNAALQDIGSLLHRIALAQTVPAAIAEDLPEYADIQRLATLFDAEEVQLFYQIAVHGRNELGLAPDDFAGFSMTLLRMLAFRPTTGEADADAGPARGGRAPAAVAPPASEPGAGTGRTRAPAPVAMAGPDSSMAAFDSGNQAGMASAALKPAGRASAALAAAAPIAKTATPPVAPVPRGSGGISPAMAALNAARSGTKLAPAVAATAPVVPASAPAVALAPATATSSASDSARAPVALPAAAPAPAPGRRASPGSEDVILALAPAPPWDDEGPAFSGAAAGPMSMEDSTVAAGATVPMPTPIPVPTLDWNGDWPALAATLAVRGVVQQLALQSELLRCEVQGDTTVLHLQVAIETLRAAATVDKLAAVVGAHFSRPVRLETSVGPVRHSANVVLLAARAERQREAEATMHGDPFVQTLLREFGATIVPGSIKPISPN